jgi:hypothetical protein
MSSNPNAVTEIFHSLNPSGCITALGPTQPLKEMSIRNTSCGEGEKGSRHIGLPSLPVSYPKSLEIREN